MTLLERIEKEIMAVRPNKDGEGLSVFADPQHPFVSPKGSCEGYRNRKLFAMGYLQAKKDICSIIPTIAQTAVEEKMDRVMRYFEEDIGHSDLYRIGELREIFTTLTSEDKV